MTKNFALLLVSALLALTLTACGKDQVPDTQVPGNGTTTDGSVGNGNGNANANGNSKSNGTGDALMPGNGTGDVLAPGDGVNGTGSTVTKQRHQYGVSYEQMLRNGRVHDTDGDLTDYENATTSRWSY